MGALMALAAAAIVAGPVPAESQAKGDFAQGARGGAHGWVIDRWSPAIRDASGRFGIPEDWIRRVIRAESGGRTLLAGRPITSNTGAMGLMQVMPATWADMRSRHGLGRDPYDPRDNILAGTAYLRAMYDRFGYPGLFAAYHAGPGRYAEHAAGGRPLPAETLAYLSAVGANPASALAATGSGGGLFVPLSEGGPADRDRTEDAARVKGSGPSLFVRLGRSPAPSR